MLLILVFISLQFHVLLALYKHSAIYVFQRKCYKSVMDDLQKTNFCKGSTEDTSQRGNTAATVNGQSLGTARRNIAPFQQWMRASSSKSDLNKQEAG